MLFYDRIIKILDGLGIDYQINSRTIYTVCPLCDSSDKFSILKQNGSCVCYRGSCSFRVRSFAEWLSLTSNIPINEAKKIIQELPVNHSSDILEVNLEPKIKEEVSELIPIVWPENGTVDIDNLEAIDGANYLNSRNIPINVAKIYGIRYVPLLRRVIFPVIMKGICYGWQGRAIDNVDKKDRMRFNLNFPRRNSLMFYDRIAGNRHVILAEGPVDAIKFHLAGGNVASMGKVLNPQQINLIKESGIDKLYLALDEDAASEMRSVLKKVNMDVMIIEVPESCKERCKKIGKKADFGECTFEEAKQAFDNAKDLRSGYLLVHLKSN